MKKRSKCIVVLLVCCLMIFSSTSSVLAANVSTPKQYTDFCCIGDSVCTGFTREFASLNYSNNFNEDGSNPNSTYRAHYGNVPSNTFLSIIREAIGARYRSMTCVGQNLVDALWILGDYEDEYDFDEAAGYHYEHQNSKTRWEAMIHMHDSKEGINRVRKSSLVLISLGSNDLFTYPKNFSTENGKIDFEKMISMMVTGYQRFITVYPRIIQRVMELNPLADVVTVSLFNPYANVQFGTDDTDKIAGKLFGLFIDNANNHIKKWANQYGATYVDVTEVGKSFGTINLQLSDLKNIQSLDDLSSLPGLGRLGSMDAHPGLVAHAYMAEKILMALPRQESRINGICDGLLHVEMEGKDIGNFTFRQKGSGWTMRNMRGQYVCINNGSIELRESDPTVWQYDGGLYTNTSGKVYLSGTKDDLILSNDQVSAELYKAN